MKKVLLFMMVASCFSGMAQTTMDKTLESASPVILKNQEELKDELNITTRDEMAAIEEIGSKVGERLVLECPKFMELTLKVMGEDEEMMDMALDEYSDLESEGEEITEAGTVVTINKAFPCQITIKNQQGETLNFIWTDPIDIDEQFVSNPDNLKGRKENIVYFYGELYDAQSGEYVSRKILTELTLQ